MSHLRTIAVRGAETHALLKSQEAAEITKKRCQEAYAGLDETPPWDTANGVSGEWRAQIRQVFVDSCVSGVPTSVKDIPKVPAPPDEPAPSAPNTAKETTAAAE